MKAEIGTPAGSSQAASITGFCVAATVKRAFGWAALVPEAGVQSLPCQSIRCAGACLVRPSHQTSPSSVSATLVKMVFSRIEAMQLKLVFSLVPGATPMVVTFQPLKLAGGISMAKLVLPQAEGKAAAM